MRERSRSDMLHGVDSSHVLFYLMSPCTFFVVCATVFVMIRSAGWAQKIAYCMLSRIAPHRLPLVMVILYYRMLYGLDLTGYDKPLTLTICGWLINRGCVPSLSSS